MHEEMQLAAQRRPTVSVMLGPKPRTAFPVTGQQESHASINVNDADTLPKGLQLFGRG